VIRISPSHCKDITAQAEWAYPYECCGLLAGVISPDGTITVTRVVASANTMIEHHTAPNDQSGRDSFEIDPQVRFDLMRALADTSETIVGHYHSHPDHPARPSERDLDMAFEPELVWLIVSVRTGQATVPQAWRLNRDSREIVSVSLEICENS
jgi:proteasome lid subunit RPN8/RPN11